MDIKNETEHLINAKVYRNVGINFHLCMMQKLQIIEFEYVNNKIKKK